MFARVELVRFVVEQAPVPKQFSGSRALTDGIGLLVGQCLLGSLHLKVFLLSYRDCQKEAFDYAKISQMNDFLRSQSLYPLSSCDHCGP